jgi:putative solute:sodium symporter small subunit
MKPENPQPRSDARGYWKAMLFLVLVLLSAWFVSSFVLGILLVEWLNQFQIGGFPLGFWFAQQGAIYIFIVIIWIFAWQADRIATRYGVD